MKKNKIYYEYQGDLIKAIKDNEFHVFVHGANCFNTMGAGIALSLVNEFPELDHVDQKSLRGSFLKLGNYTMAITRNGVGVNLYTQYYPGKDLNYTALRLGLEKINHVFKRQVIGMPMIGCGLGGGKWSIVKKIIHDTMTECVVKVVVDFKKDQPLVEIPPVIVRQTL